MVAQTKICVVTGSRADYGLLTWLMKGIVDDSDLALQVIVTGAHLSERYGKTVREIEGDGFIVDARVPIVGNDDSRAAAVIAMADALRGIGEALERLTPDFVVVLGDRYEILAAGQAAFILGIPLVHIHGGEITEGALDDGFRHALTKLSNIHFVATEAYRDRVIQMGENPENVFVVGGLGAESVARLESLNDGDLARLLRRPISDPLLLVTYHPETAGPVSPQAGVGELIDALKEFPAARIVITGVNADPGNQVIREAFKTFSAARPDMVSLHDSLGMRGYLSAMRRAAAVVGNSSSGILEAPIMDVPTIDIGTRQAGRIKASSVISCRENAAEIAVAIRTAISSEFRTTIKNQHHPYGDGRPSERMIPILKSFAAQPVAPKRFRDLAIS